jgi:hypothetical protein
MNIILIVLIVEFVTLFIFIFLQWKREEGSELKLNFVFEKLVEENKLFIHYKDVLNKRLIGFDKQNKKLLLLNVNNSDKVAACINMDEIDSCSIVHLNNESSKSLKKVFLELVRKENNEPIRFCFFDESYDDMREKTCLLLKAKHWHQRINFHKRYWWINQHEFVL